MDLGVKYSDLGKIDQLFPTGIMMPFATCIISNGFASMGIGVPDAIAAKLAFPDCTALTVTGDAGLLPTLQQAIADDTVVLIDCPVDYSENMKLTEKLGALVCPI